MKTIIILFIVFKIVAYCCYRVDVICEGNYYKVKLKWKTIKDAYCNDPLNWHYTRYGPDAWCRWCRQLQYQHIIVIVSFINYQRLRFYYIVSFLKQLLPDQQAAMEEFSELVEAAKERNEKR